MKRIHKVIAVVIKDNKLLMVRKKGKDIWTSLGGRIESGETERECLLREIKEEFNCGVKIIKKLGDFEDRAVFDDTIVKLSAFLVEIKGEIKLSDPELKEYRFINKDYKREGIKLPPSIENQIIPLLIKEKLLEW
jgi:8-oxo-dGTP pyrophosphatase MutT (NUDIX family)